MEQQKLLKISSTLLTVGIAAGLVMCVKNLKDLELIVIQILEITS